MAPVTEAWAHAESELDRLGFDDARTNLRCVVPAFSPPPEDYREALQRLEAAARRARGSARLLALRGKAYSNLGRVGEAVKELERSLALDPADERARLWLAEARLLSGSFAEALRLAGESSGGWGPFYKAAALVGSGRAGEALAEASAAAASLGEAGLAGAALAALIEGGLSFERGRERLDLVAERCPEKAWPHHLAAWLASGLGRPAEAAAAYERALARQPDDADALRALASLRLREGRQDDAASALDAALRLRPRWPEALWDRASIELSRGTNDGYIALLERLLEAAPDWPQARASAVRALLRRGSFDRAETLVKAGLRRTPKDPELLYLKGRVLAHRGRSAEAAAVYRRVLAARPAWHEPCFHLAAALQVLERDEEMVDRLAESLRRSPPPAHDDSRALLDRFRLALLSGRFEDAFALGERTLDLSRRREEREALRWPVFIEEFDLTYASLDFHRRSMDALARLASTGSGEPWASYYHAILAASWRSRLIVGADEAFKTKLAASRRDSLVTVRAADPARYGWMRLELGKERLYSGDLADALEDFQASAGATDPPNWLALCQAAEATLCLGDVAGALRRFEEAERAADRESLGCVLGWKGEFLLWIGEYAHALELEEQALARAAQYAHCWKGAALVLLGRPAEALGPLQKAIEASPWDYEAKVWRAEALWRLGRSAEAVAEADVSIGLGGVAGGGAANLYSYVVRGLARAALGDFSGMRQDWLRLSPEIPVPGTRWTIGGYAAERLGLPEPPADAEVERGLRWILEQSRGVRRADYALRVWMR